MQLQKEKKKKKSKKLIALLPEIDVAQHADMEQTDNLMEVNISSQNWDYIVPPINSQQIYPPIQSPLTPEKEIILNPLSSRSNEELIQTLELSPSAPALHTIDKTLESILSQELVPSAPDELMLTLDDFQNVEDDLVEVGYQNPLITLYETDVINFRQYSLGGG